MNQEPRSVIEDRGPKVLYRRIDEADRDGRGQTPGVVSVPSEMSYISPSVETDKNVGPLRVVWTENGARQKVG